MARKATSRKPRHVEYKHESPGQLEGGGQEGHGFAPPVGKAISKAHAVRAALAAGFDGPQEGTAYIRKEFGIELAPQHFSAVKSQQKKKEGEQKAKGGRKPTSSGVKGYLAPPPKQRAMDGETTLLAALEAMKPLVASLGVEKVKRLAELLG
jgi:hypothetical protein